MAQVLCNKDYQLLEYIPTCFNSMNHFGDIKIEFLINFTMMTGVEVKISEYSWNMLSRVEQL